LIVALALAGMASMAQAAPTGQIELAVTSFWEHRLEEDSQKNGWKLTRFTLKNSAIEVAHSDSSEPCPVKPVVHARGDDSSVFARQRLSVSCPSAPGWGYTLNSQAKIYINTVFSRQTLERGQEITRDQVEVRELNISRQPNSYITRLHEAVGKSSLRRIRANQALNVATLATAWWVRRGQKVSVVAHHGDIHATTQGYALEDGRQSDVVRVRNPDSNKIINAKVVEPGVVSSTFD
jgi:flagella basal body P-ring formation protein FlgA